MKLRSLLETERTFDTVEDVIAWMMENQKGSTTTYSKKDVEVTPDGIVFKNNFTLANPLYNEIPFKISKVEGRFTVTKFPGIAYKKKLTSSKNFPDVVNENVILGGNSLESVSFNKVGGNINVSGNSLKSISFNEVGGSIDVSGNKLNTFDGFPSHIKGNLYISNNNFTTLKGIHTKIKRVDGIISISNCPVKESVLGLLKIEGLKSISPLNYYSDWYKYEDDKQFFNGVKYNDFHKALVIVSKHVGKGTQGLLAAHRELIEADLEDYATF